MSSVKTQSRYDASRHMNFISTAPYNTNFWTYTYTNPGTGNNFRGSGALSQVLNRAGNAVSATDCPAGRILRANGKKLYLDAAAVPALPPWDDRTPLVGVYDYSTGLSGFIDPNQTVFALYNVDKPVDATDEESSKGRNTHKGMSIFTGGNITTTGGLIGYSTTTGTVAAVTQLTNKGATVVLNTPTGQITMNNANINATANVSFTLTNSFISSANDIVLVNLASTLGMGNYSIIAVPSAGSALITVRNTTAGILGDALVLRFVVIKGVSVT